MLIIPFGCNPKLLTVSFRFALRRDVLFYGMEP
jgi:hypothetical protein